MALTRTISDFVPLRQLREESGLLAREVAKRADVTVRDLNKMENGRHGATLQVAERLAGALNCTLEIRFVPKP